MSARVGRADHHLKHPGVLVFEHDSVGVRRPDNRIERVGHGQVPGSLVRLFIGLHLQPEFNRARPLRVRLARIRRLGAYVVAPGVAWFETEYLPGPVDG